MSTEQEIANDIFGFFADGLGFVEYAFPWGEKGTPLEDFPDGPDEWHREEFKRMAAHIIENLNRKNLGLSQLPYQSGTASGHGIGKSAMVAWVILWLMSTRKHCRGVVTANTGNQLSEKTWPELAKWHNMAINKQWFKWTATCFYCVLEKGGEKNWKFDAVTWSLENTEAFAGLHNASSAVVTIYDEASAIPDKIWEVTEGTMTDGEPFWFAFGNPTRNSGRFRQCFGKLRHRWYTRHVDSRTVRITNKEKLQQWVDDYGEDSDFVRVRVKGVFPAGGSKQFISNGLVDGAKEREVIRDNGAPLILGVDVARFGDDENVCRFRQGRDARSIEPVKWRGMDNMQSAYKVAELIRRYDPDAVNIDAGNGSGVIDRLRELGYRVNEIWFGSTKTRNPEYYNVRTEMYGELREWLGGGCIDHDDKLYDDLTAPEYEFSGDGGDRIKLESKEKMKDRGLASTDDGDALALTFAKKIARKDTKASRHRRPRVAKDVDYDIFG